MFQRDRYRGRSFPGFHAEDAVGDGLHRRQIVLDHKGQATPGAVQDPAGGDRLAALLGVEQVHLNGVALAPGVRTSIPAASSSSTSAGKTRNPEVLMISFFRSTMVK